MFPLLASLQSAKLINRGLYYQAFEHVCNNIDELEFYLKHKVYPHPDEIYIHKHKYLNPNYVKVTNAMGDEYLLS